MMHWLYLLLALGALWLAITTPHAWLLLLARVVLLIGLLRHGFHSFRCERQVRVTCLVSRICACTVACCRRMLTM